MKELQKAPLPQAPPGPGDPKIELEEKIGLDDRLAAAGAALVFGAPTAFLIWLLALSAGKFAHLALPRHYAFFAIWAVLVIYGFLSPRSVAESFGSLWARLLAAFGILAAVLYFTMGTR